MTKPFAGVRILDFTRVLAGPFASYQLALLGADVIKVEAKGGDDARRGGGSAEWEGRGLPPGFMAVNANKRSLTLDLKNPKAIEVVRRLVTKADVVMENFRPGVMDGLGIGYQALSEINPRLIYCAVSGFGQTGPERGRAAFDGMIQAMSGLMSITGHPEMGPTRVGFAGCDVTAGATAAFGVASALFQRTHTGKGQLIDVAMLEAMLSFLGQQVTEHMVTGRVHGQAANLSVTRKPTADLYRTGGNGYLVLAVLTEKQFASLMHAIGRADLLQDPRFADWPSRIANGPALHALIEAALASADAETWAERLKGADCPSARVWSIPEIVRHPQVAGRDLLQTVNTEWGPVTLAGSGFRLAHGGGGVDRPPPGLGQHTAEVLGEAGYSAPEIAGLREAGAI
ncbi:CaiB/BaiF CoA transferase family protein [Desertibaculum subflavum]|uniref:CaiB/BaiF CoA transferase family protein n=1 Tax=Desertibaculum subflavum TaxID=2268458 RepID=UPI000E67392E